MALPQYTHWEIYEINEENLGDIRDELHVGDENGIIDKLRRTVNALPANMPRCEAIFRDPYQAPLQIDNIMSFDNGIVSTRNYIVIDTILRYPVAFISIDVGNPLSHTLFNYYRVLEDDPVILALGVFIHWTCSFTQSRVICHGGVRMSEHYAFAAATHKINVANYVTDQIAEQLLDELNDLGMEIEGEPVEVNNVIFYSIGIEGARERHRKNGKLSACRFMYKWDQIETHQKLPDVFDQPSYENTMYYFYIRGGPPFNINPLKQYFINQDDDISYPNGTYPVGHPRYFNDENFSCPKGPIDDGDVPNNMAGGYRRRRKTRHKSRTKRRRSYRLTK
jgi:hypothetical protein